MSRLESTQTIMVSAVQGKPKNVWLKKNNSVFRRLSICWEFNEQFPKCKLRDIKCSWGDA